MPVLFDKISFSYEKKPVSGEELFNELSFIIEEGEFILLSGYEGTGKSTLIQMVNGLIYPKKGKVFVDGLDTSKKRNLFEIRKKTGLVFQYPEKQFFSFSVREELLFALINFKLSCPEKYELISESALETVGLHKDMLEKNPFELSGGEQRQVAIASILAYSPKYLFFDEPTAGLDAANRRRFIKILEGIRKKGGTVLVVSHDKRLLKENIFTKTVFIESGSLKTRD